MNGNKALQLALALSAVGLLVLAACHAFRDIISPVGIILRALLISLALACVLVLARRLPIALRKQGLKHAAVIGLLLILAFLAYFWRQGDFRDALLFLPLTLLAVLLALVPLFALSWVASSLILGSARVQAHATRILKSPFKSRLAGGLFSVAVVACLIIFLLIPWKQVLTTVDSARATRMKSRNRGIWVAITSESEERQASGLPLLWPHDLGFTGSESSTDYFRRLFANEAGQIMARHEDRLVPDLNTWSLGGPGLPKAASAEAFGPENNAWQVVCIGENAPAMAPFLISRNVDFGDTLTPTSHVHFIRSGPLRLRRIVWLTRGGGIYATTPNLFKVARFFVDQDLPDAPTAYRVMRP